MQPLIKQMPRAEADRRRFTRMVIPPHVTVVAGVAALGTGGRRVTATGRVRDISARGLSLALPPEGVCSELSAEGRPLALVVTLPAGTISLRAEARHCSTVKVGRSHPGCVVGVRVTEIGEGDDRVLADYLSRGG